MLGCMSYKTKRAPTAPMASPAKLAPESLTAAPVYGAMELDDGVAVGAYEVPKEVTPVPVGPAAPPTGPAVVAAGALLGPPAASPVIVLVWPAETTVEVVNWT